MALCNGSPCISFSKNSEPILYYYNVQALIQLQIMVRNEREKKNNLYLPNSST